MVSDEARYNRISSLTTIQDQLLVDNEEKRFQCLFRYHNKKQGDCLDHYDIETHDVVFNNIANILTREPDQINEDDFVYIMRSLFCKLHNPSKEQWEEWKTRLQTLWLGASSKDKAKFLDVLKTSGRGIDTPKRPPSSRLSTPKTTPRSSRSRSRTRDSISSLGIPAWGDEPVSRFQLRGLSNGRVSPLAVELSPPTLRHSSEFHETEYILSETVSPSTRRSGRRVSTGGGPGSRSPGPQQKVLPDRTKRPIASEHSESEENTLPTPDGVTLPDLGANFEISTPDSDPESRGAKVEPPKTKTPTGNPVKHSGLIAHEIHNLLLRDILPLVGWIYVLTAPVFFKKFEKAGGESWVKIGIAQSPRTRVEALRQQCGMGDLQEYDLGSFSPLPMDQLFRIEAICHEELSNFRRPFKCPKCGANHREWFNVSPEIAARTVKKWRRFLDHMPYTKEGMLRERWKRWVIDGEVSKVEEGESHFDLDKPHAKFEKWITEGCESIPKP